MKKISNLIKRVSTDDGEQAESKNRTHNSRSRRSSRSSTRSHNNGKLNDSTDGSELAENEIIPSDIAKDVKDILSNDSDQSDTDQGRDEYDYYKIGQDVMQEVFRTDSSHCITKKYDIQSFDEELMGHTIYKGLFIIHFHRV